MRHCLNSYTQEPEQSGQVLFYLKLSVVNVLRLMERKTAHLFLHLHGQTHSQSEQFSHSDLRCMLHQFKMKMSIIQKLKALLSKVLI